MLIEGEETARDLFGAVILRPAGIYGPGRDHLIRTVLEGRPVEHGRRTNRIHEVDLARAILALLSSPAPPALLHAADGAPALLGEVVAHLAQRLGVPRRARHRIQGRHRAGCDRAELLGDSSSRTSGRGTAMI